MEFKHFSHAHNLIPHQMPPEEAETHCSGCNYSSGSGSVFYVCWHCNFFLHEQCFQATRSMKHPSHPAHPLTLIPYPTYPSNSFFCNSCNLVGSGFSYSCSECEFDLHIQCANMNKTTTIPEAYPYVHYISNQTPTPPAAVPPLCKYSKEIQHKSHPEHPLKLLSSPSYKEDGEFTCNACFRNGTDFTYHCSTCKFDLHVNCASLPEAVKREDHEHPLVLYYSSPFKNDEGEEENVIFVCDVCHETVHESCWVYYCQECDYGTHSDCVNAEECPETESAEESILATQQKLQMLQFQMDMSRQNAELIKRMGQSMLNLV